MKTINKQIIMGNRSGLEHATKIPDAVFTFETLDYLDTYAGKRADEKFGIDRKEHSCRIGRTGG